MKEILDVLNLVGLGGVSVFLYYLFKGLRERITTLTQLAEEQKKTLEAVRTRAEEMDRLSSAYKQAVSDFQEMGEKLDLRRKELIQELEAANERKDGELAKLANIQLQEIELKKKSLERLPELEKNLENAVRDLGRQLRIVAPVTEQQASLFWYWPLTSAPSCEYFPSLLQREQTPSITAVSNYLRQLLLKQMAAEPKPFKESGQAESIEEDGKEKSDEKQTDSNA